MLELPEVLSRAKELKRSVAGRTVLHVDPPTRAHKFCFFHGDPAAYDSMLAGSRITGAEGFGIFLDLAFEGGTTLSVNDGVNVRRYASLAEAPANRQLLLALDDGGALVFTVAMYGGLYCHRGDFDNAYYSRSKTAVSPLDEAFDRPYFDALMQSVKPVTSVKALLATEQRIPGLGNGVLQDVLFIAGLHPKRKVASLTPLECDGLFDSVKNVLKIMTERGGRDTEKDLFGNPGGYKTLLSKNTLPYPCPNCGGPLRKEPYLGGAVYYCPSCQPEQG